MLLSLLVLLSATDTLWRCHGEGYPLHEQDFVVKLTDETFEHETQASTGMTTGSWLIWFHTSRDKTPIAGDVPAPEVWTDNHIVLATLDGKANPNTRARFQLKYGNTKLPCFVFLHKGKYYKLQSPPKGYFFNWEGVTKFVTETYTKAEGLDIPPPRTFMDEIRDFFSQVNKEFGGVYFTSMGYFFAFMMGLAVVQKLFDSSKPAPQKTKSD